MQTIHKTKQRRDFTLLPNSILRSKSLDFSAKGILVMMLSHTEEWKATMEQLMEYCHEGVAINRRINFRKAIHQLEAAGYAKRAYIRKCGKIMTTVWHWYDEPIPVGERSRPTDHSPKVGLLKVGTPKVSGLTISKPTNNKKTNGEEDYTKEDMVSKEEDHGDDLGWGLVEEDIRYAQGNR